MQNHSHLTASLTEANKLANRLLRSALLSDFIIREMGWKLVFSLNCATSNLAGTSNLILEESCEERAFTEEGRLLQDEQEIVGYFINKTVLDVSISTESSLIIRFSDNGYISFEPADFSMDWEWIISPDDEELTENLSIVSVHGEEVWSRYPQAFDSWMFDD